MIAQFRLPTVVKTVKFSVKREEKILFIVSEHLKFQQIQKFTVKIPKCLQLKFLPFTDFPTPPPPPPPPPPSTYGPSWGYMYRDGLFVSKHSQCLYGMVYDVTKCD